MMHAIISAAAGIMIPVGTIKIAAILKIGDNGSIVAHEFRRSSGGEGRRRKAAVRHRR